MGPGRGHGRAGRHRAGLRQRAVGAAAAGAGVGVVAAAGTGAQEVSTLLDRWGVGVSQVIGVGGRDLSEQVGGLMARLAVRALDDDPGTGVVLLVSKPPAGGGRARCCAVQARRPASPSSSAWPAPERRRRVVQLVARWRRARGAALRLAGGRAAGPRRRTRDTVEAAACRGWRRGRRTVRGLFSGGTLCYEAQLIVSRSCSATVYSNEPLRARARSARTRPAPTYCSTSVRRSTRAACRIR